MSVSGDISLDLDPPLHDNYAITNNQQTTLQWLGWAGGGAEGETTKKSVLTSEYLGTAGSITTEILPPISQSNDKHCGGRMGLPASLVSTMVLTGLHPSPRSAYHLEPLPPSLSLS